MRVVAAFQSEVAWLAVKGFAVWLVILGLAFANAALRELVLIPQLGKTWGLVLSGLFLAALVLVVAWASLPWLDTRRAAGLLAVGLGWLVLTIVFDIAMGRLQGKPTQQLLDAYLFKDGNLWPLVLLVTFIAPCLAAKSRGWI